MPEFSGKLKEKIFGENPGSRKKEKESFWKNTDNSGQKQGGSSAFLDF